MYEIQGIINRYDINRKSLPEELRRKLDCFDDAVKQLPDAGNNMTQKFIKSGLGVMDFSLSRELINFIDMNRGLLYIFQNNFVLQKPA